MSTDRPDPSDAIALAGTDDPMDLVRLGIAAAREQNFERGLVFLAEAYRRLSGRPDTQIPASALSYYGLCLALNKGRIREAAEFCQLAIQREFYNSEHYLNLSKVWSAGRSRRKAIEAVDRGLAVEPHNEVLARFRVELGIRRSPVLPFLHRDNPLNVTLGRVRHSLASPKAAGGERRRKKR
jgi:tetratricopeptide (TPR) repeat protein